MTDRPLKAGAIGEPFGLPKTASSGFYGIERVLMPELSTIVVAWMRRSRAGRPV